jgi:hypothetical protein
MGAMRALHLVLVVALVVPAGALGGVAADTGAASPSPSPATATVPQIAAGTDPAQVTGGVLPPTPPGTVHALGLQPNATNRTDVRGTHVDLGPALGFETASASAELGTLRAVERVDAAEDESATARRLRAALTAIENRADGLGRAQRDAFDAYLSNETTSRALLVRLAHVDRAARSLADRRDRLVTLAETRGIALDDDRLAALGRELGVYTGPVRARAAAVLGGSAAPGRFYVGVTDRAVVLATLTDEAYLREGYRGDLRQTGRPKLSEGAAYNAVARAYPNVWAERRETSFAAAGGVAVVRVGYDRGTLVASIAADNGRVFADVHRQPLDEATTAATVSNARDGLRLTINRSYAGGPLRARVVDESGTPVDADVTVGPAGGRSVTVGRTGSDGSLYALTPGDRFTVVAIRDQSVVFLTADPLTTPRP